MRIQPPTTAYRIVAESLRDAIRRGQHTPGDKLTPQNTVGRRYNVNQGTVSAAVNLIRREGMVRRLPGEIGYTVNTPRHIHRDAMAYPDEPWRVTTRPERIDADPDTARALGIAPGHAVGRRRHRMTVDGDPVHMAVSYMPWTLARIVDAAGDSGERELDSVHARLAAVGHPVVSVRETVGGRMATPVEDAFFGGGVDQPVFVVRRLSLTHDGRPVELCVYVMPLHRWSMVYTWDTTG